MEVPGKEARAAAGHRDRETPANLEELTAHRSPRVDAWARACVRTTFARCTTNVVPRHGRGEPRGATISTSMPGVHLDSLGLRCRGLKIPASASGAGAWTERQLQITLGGAPRVPACARPDVPSGTRVLFAAEQTGRQSQLGCSTQCVSTQCVSSLARGGTPGLCASTRRMESGRLSRPFGQADIPACRRP